MTHELNPAIYQRMLANWRREVLTQGGRDGAQRATEDQGATQEYRLAAKAALDEWRGRER